MFPNPIIEEQAKIWHLKKIIRKELADYFCPNDCALNRQCEACAELQGISQRVAEVVHNAGYRKMDEITLKLDLGDRSAEEIQQIAEAFNKAMANEQPLITVPSNEEEIAKRVAKEIYKRVDEFRKLPELNPRDSYDCNALDAYNNVCKFINRKYGVEIEE